MFLKRTRLEVRSCFCKLTPKFASELTPSLPKKRGGGESAMERLASILTPFALDLMP